MRPYTPKIPAMITGTIDLKISEGLLIPTEQMPTEALAVPYADPISIRKIG